MSDNIFTPVGNTDEASALMGTSGRVWSPFSPFFNQRAAVKRDFAEERGRFKRIMRRNPLSEQEKLALVSGTDPKAIVPVTASLAVGGLIVNRAWEDAADYCEYLVRHYHSRIGGARAKADAARAKKGQGPKIISSSAITWAVAFSAIGQYCRALAEGREPTRPARTIADRKVGAVISMWDDVRKSCLAAEGNVKLPFAAYSEMPVVTCPGAGGVTKFSGLTGKTLGVAVPTGPDVRGCASFCYSLKAFGKPTCVARQLILTLGAAVDPVRHAQIVTEQMTKLAKGKKHVKILRLFVDGDFRSEASIIAWMDHCVKPLHALGVTVYGYSKSWEHLWNVHKEKGAAWWPTNYVMNVSSGSRFRNGTDLGTSAEISAKTWQERIRSIPVARGGFLAVDPIQRLLWKAMTKVHGEAVWQKYCDAVSRHVGHPGAAEKLLHAVKSMIGKANPALVTDYNNYVNTIHIIENKPSVLKRIASIAGEKALKPGPVVQASTWAFLSELVKGQEMPCPIACGSCPKTAIITHDKVVRAALQPELDALGAEMQKKHGISEKERRDWEEHVRGTDATTVSAGEAEARKNYRAQVAAQIEKGSPLMHWCGNKKMKQDIIIGLH
jgi:hypothetical protein